MTQSNPDFEMREMPLPPQPPPEDDFPCCAPTGFSDEPTLTASEVKVLTETASKFGYELGRKEALTERPMWRRHRADVGEQIAEELEALNGPITPLAAAAFVRDLTSLPSHATSDATSGVPGHPGVSEAVRSPQEPGEGS